MPEGAVRTAQVQAWAKVNLDLRILAREASGFHQLETIFQRISMADDVEVQVGLGSGITLRCDPALDVPNPQNLAWRAAAAYREAAQWPDAAQEVAIVLTKRIPTGAGLGGGSADAGAVLRALNALNPAPLSMARLLAIAATLGADVPFLTTEAASALAWGRGERMLALPSLPTCAVHLATFREGVNTAAAYGALAESRTAGSVAPHHAALHTIASLQDWSSLAASSCNDFETPVFALRPDVAQVHHAWHAAAPSALVRLSGSGATVFAITPERSARDAVVAIASRWPDGDGVRHVVARTLEEVPAVAILSSASGFR
ncbi:MAG: 4-(cytidine 5'-diphospho)-2-C-methyl-D-erythritol kinase [Gemmatimonadota bacterium]